MDQYIKLDLVLDFLLKYKKIIKKILFSIFSIIFIFYLIINIIEFLSFNKYKDYIEKFCSENYNIDLNIEKDIKVVIWPKPYLLLENVNVKYNGSFLTYIKKMYLPISPLTLFGFTNNHYSIKNKILIDEATINPGGYNQYITNEFKLKKDKRISNLEIKKLYFKEKTKNLYNSEIQFNIPRLENFQFEHTNDKIIFYGDFIKYGIQNNFSFNLNNINSDKQSLNIAFNGDSLDFSIKSDNLIIKDNSIKKFKGTVFSNIKNFNSFISLFLSNPDSINHLITNPMFKNEEIKLNTNIEFDENLLKFNNLSLNANFIEDFQSTIKILIDQELDLSSEIKIKHLNIDQFLNEEYVNSISINIIRDSLLGVIFDYFKLLEKNSTLGYFKVKIDKISIIKNEISNFLINFDLIPESILVNDLTFNTAGNTKIKTTGSIVYNEFGIPKYLGNLIFTSKNPKELLKKLQINNPNNNDNKNLNFIVMTSDLIILPYHINLDNINIAMGTNTVVGGNARFAESNNNNLVSYVYLLGNEINLDSIGISNKLNEYISNLEKADKDKNGALYYEITNDHKWLRNLKGRKFIRLDFDKVHFNNKIIDKLYSTIILSTNKINFQEIKLNSYFLSLNGAYSFFIPLFRPYMNGQFNIDKVSLEEAKDFLFYKTNLNQNDNDNFNFFSTFHYDGKIGFIIQELALKNLLLKHINGNLRWSNGLISLDKLSMNAFYGNINLFGNVNLFDLIPSFYVNYNASNIEPKDALNYIIQFDKLQGYMSLGGYLQSVGKNFNELKQNLGGKINFICKKSKWNGFSLDEIINATDDEKDQKENRIARIEYYSKYGESYFDNIEGKISADKGIFSINEVNIQNNRTTGTFASNYNIFNNNIKSLATFSFIPSNSYSPINIKLDTTGYLPNNTNTKFDISEILYYVGYSTQQEEEEKDDKSKIEEQNIPLRNKVIQYYNGEIVEPKKS